MASLHSRPLGVARAVIFAIVFWGSAAQGASAQVADSTAPSLDNFTFNLTSIDVGSGPQNVAFNVHVTDDLSGVVFGCVGFESPSTTQFRSGCFDETTRLSGDALDGVYGGVATFPQFSEAGVWHVKWVYAYDAIGNNRFLLRPDLEAMGAPTELTVIGGPDLAAPEIDGFDFAPLSIDTSAGPASVTITVHLTDQLSGVVFGCAGFESPSATQFRSACYDETTRSSGDAHDGVYTGVATFPQYGEAGTWHVKWVYAYDAIGNNRFLLTSDLADAGAPTLLDVASNPDLTAPAIDGFSFGPTSIDTSDAAQSVTVSVHLTDNLSGVVFGCVGFESPSSAQFRSACYDETTRVSGNNFDGVYTGTATFPQFSEIGTWHVKWVYAYDAIGNNRFLLTADLEALGINTELIVGVPTPPEQVQSLTDTVTDLDLGNGTTNSLISKLAAARHSLETGNTTAAMNQLAAFINQVNALEHSGRLDTATAAELIALAQAIINEIS